MKSTDVEALVAYRMERSHASIEAAKLMLENNMFAFSMNSIYYAMFYAVHGFCFCVEFPSPSMGRLKDILTVNS